MREFRDESECLDMQFYVALCSYAYEVEAVMLLC